jgi:iron-sulfur cluster repair protein YtfE (RIC family)
MKRHESLYKLSHEHHRGLLLAQLIKKNAPRYRGLPNTLKGKVEYTINFYKNDLIKHFRAEEKILFQAVQAKNQEIDSLFEEIFNEHNLIRDLVLSLNEGSNHKDTLDKLGNLLTKHIRKEERLLFPMIEEALTGAELKKLKQLLTEAE